MTTVVDLSEEELRERAVRRLQKKRDFTGHLVAYVSVNLLLIGVWAASGGAGGFWPVYVLGLWGIGLAMHGWDAYFPEPSPVDVEREMRKMRSPGASRR